MDLMRPRHFSPPRNVLSRRQYCKASERVIVHPTYLQPPERTCIASSLDFWNSCFQCFQSTLAHPNQFLHLENSAWLNGANLVCSLALPFSKNLYRPFVLVTVDFGTELIIGAFCARSKFWESETLSLTHPSRTVNWIWWTVTSWLTPKWSIPTKAFLSHALAIVYKR